MRLSWMWGQSDNCWCPDGAGIGITDGSCWDQQHTLAGCRQVLLHYPRELSKPLVFQARSNLGGKDLSASSRQGCSFLDSVRAMLEAVC